MVEGATAGYAYDTLNRRYSAAQSRWITPDPAGLRAVNPSNPQTWNRYAYVMNNPLAMTDVLGLDPHGCQGMEGQPCGTALTCGGGSGLGGGATPCSTPCTSVDGGGCVSGGLLGSDDSTVQCPDNVCNGYDNGRYFEFVAGAGGAEAYVSSSALGNLNEVNGVFVSAAMYAVYIANGVEAQHEALADAISLASNSPDGSNWDYIYQNLIPDQIHGGHEDFDWIGDPSILNFVPQEALDWGGCPVSCRYGFMDQIHYNNNMFHLDTVGVNWGFGLGALLHGLIDVGLGNINPSIPMGP